MQSAGLHKAPDGTGAPGYGRPLVIAAVAWMVGLAVGNAFPILWLWLSVSLGVVVMTAVMWVRGGIRGVRCWGLVGLVVVGGAWMVVREHRLPADSVGRFLGPHPQLVEVIGQVEDQPRLTLPDRGAFAHYSFRAPGTVFVMKLDSVINGGEWRPLGGRLLVKIDQVDIELRRGQRIRAIGWLSRFNGPTNPGQIDFRKVMARRGLDGRLSLKLRDNWHPMERVNTTGSWQRLRNHSAAAAVASLRLGMLSDAPITESPDSSGRLSADQHRLGFLGAILLGRRGGETAELRESFRVVGLAHLMSISGAHLAILLGLVWCVGRAVTVRPPQAAMLVLVVLALYLLAVPLRTPIVRAGIMAGLFSIAYAAGRRVSGLDLLALAALVVLIWQPADLLSPGFQLSFGAVAGLLLFVSPCVALLCGVETVADPADIRWWQRLWRWLMTYVAVNVVAFLVILPVVVHHFGFITPLSPLMSLVTLPLVLGVLALGYAKVLVGLVFPSVGWLMAVPLKISADWLVWCVEAAASWPGVLIELARGLSFLWTIATLILVVALFSGWFTRRYLALAGSVAVCVVWGVLETGAVNSRGMHLLPSRRSVLTLNAFDVGDGSSYLVRVDSRTQRGSGGGGQVWMYDCGSQHYLDVGSESISPALRALGVRQIDTLVLSHAHLDHYNGVLDVLEKVKIHRVLVPPHLMAAAGENPESATAFLVDTLRARQVRINVVSRGWREEHNGAQFEMLWPPADLDAASPNDTSLVLSIRTGGRRVLLCGDIQDQSMTGLLESGDDLRADVCELPHHGSIVETSPRWLGVVGPALVIQSSGRARLIHDRWPPILESMGIERLITARTGMIELRIDRDRGMSVSTFRDRGRSPPALDHSN